MNNHTIKPIFIFSLPRSGSTLLQRILGNHQHIHTVSEPWILLPFLGAMNPNGTYTEYSQNNTSIALNEFFQHLPNCETDYYKEIRNVVINLYQKICSKQKQTAKYFLDKTPRYHYILDQIHHTFPEGKFIYLMRNPLSVVGSMLQTETKGIWNLYLYNVDLYNGLNNLIKYQNKYSTSSLLVNYENLIKNPKDQIAKICEYLEIEEFQNGISLESNQFLNGKMGDRVDLTKENNFKLEAIHKWKDVINNPVRKQWCCRYINWIGSDRLNAMGYDKETILNSLYGINAILDRQTLKDIYRILFGVFYSILEYTIVKNNLKRLSNVFQICAKT